MSGEKYPTIGAGYLAYSLMMMRLEDNVEAHVKSDSTFMAIVSKAAWSKLRKWFSKTGGEIYAIGCILDPRNKMDYFRRAKWDTGESKDLLRKVPSDLRFTESSNVTLLMLGQGCVEAALQKIYWEEAR